MNQTVSLTKPLLTCWQGVNSVLRKLIRQIPDSALDFRPTENNFTLRELVLHILESEIVLTKGIKQGEIRLEDFQNYKHPEVKNVSELLARVKETQETTRQLLSGMTEEQLAQPISSFWFPEPQPVFYYLTLTYEHTIHHRGQMYVYLRLLGIEPVESFDSNEEEVSTE